MHLKRNWILAVAALVVVALLISQGGVKSVGFTPLAVSKIELQSSNPLVNGAAFALTFAGDGSGKSGSVRLSPEYVSGFTGSQTFGETLTLETEVVQSDCSWKIQEPTSAGASDFVYSASFWDAYGSGTRLMGTNCHQDGANCGSAKEFISNPVTVTSVCANAPSPAYAIARPSVTTTYNIVQEVRLKHADGSLYASAQVSPSKPTAELRAADGSLVGIVQNVGSLMGSQSCPNIQSDTLLLRSLGTNAYSAAAGAYLGAAQSAKSSYASVQAGACSGTADSLKAAGAALNSADYELVHSTPFSASETSCEFKALASGETAYSCTPIAPAAIPVTTVFLKADVVGFTIPQGKPAISGVSPTAWTRGSSQKVSVQVQNGGSQSDAFDVSSVCNPSIGVTSARVSVPASQSASASLEFANAFAGSYACVFRAASANVPSNYAEKAATIVVSNPACPFACCVGDNDYLDKNCGSMVLPTNKTPDIGAYVCTNHNCLWVDGAVAQPTSTPQPVVGGATPTPLYVGGNSGSGLQLGTDLLLDLALVFFAGVAVFVALKRRR